jgi:patatin-like phospholipase/acyl hydrolase
MKDLFDMMSGTSTGSILATSLAIPKTVGSNEPMFWASDAVKIYADGGPDIF